MFNHDTLINDVLRFLKSDKSDKFQSVRNLIEKTSHNNPYDPKKYSNYYLMWLEQCGINFPLLYLASIYLYIYATKRGINTFLFATRDCCHWIKIFKKLFPEANIHYFHCSRNMLELATGKKHNAYNRYVRSLVPPENIEKTIFIDIHGTGKRALAYFEKEYKRVPHCLLLSATCRYYQDFPDISRDYAKKNKLINLIFDARGTPIEMLNYDIIGTLQDFSDAGPIRDALEYDMERLESYHTCIDHIVSQLDSLPDNVDKLYSLDELYQIIKKIYKVIQDNKPALAEYIKHPSKHVKQSESSRDRNRSMSTRPDPKTSQTSSPVPLKKTSHQDHKIVRTFAAVQLKNPLDYITPRQETKSISRRDSNDSDHILEKMERKAIAKLEKKALKEKEKLDKKRKRNMIKKIKNIRIVQGNIVKTKINLNRP